MWLYLNSFCSRVVRQRKAAQCRRGGSCSLVLPASRLSSLQQVIPTRAADLYHGSPLADLTPKIRGEVLATWARNVMNELMVQDCLTDPVPGLCVDGRRRSWRQSEYDWLCNDRRTECKSSQLHFDINKGGWFFRFSGVKLPHQGHRTKGEFDDLLLVLYTPLRLYIYRHDLVTGVTTAGRATPSRGHVVRIGSSKTVCWRSGLESILAKLDAEGNACERIADLPLGDHRVGVARLKHVAHVMHNVYDNVPLARLSPPARGLVFKSLAREVDSVASPSLTCSDPSSCGGKAGQRRCVHTAPYDWIRGGVRVECKSAQLTWCVSRECWKVVFKPVRIVKHLKTSYVFDELQLVIYTPQGIHIYHHDLQLGVSSTGLATEAEGCAIVILGPKEEMSWSKALDAILGKLDRGGCRRIAYIHWD